MIRVDAMERKWGHQLLGLGLDSREIFTCLFLLLMLYMTEEYWQNTGVRGYVLRLQVQLGLGK